ncbi:MULTISPECIES: TylF/MycF/NovP-related O-methyltransferase [Phenylobacterium]|uniref:O-methyltransferase YrrM n=1 Tax=Phenylobacterium koreense TaxID=266125 RepID=A0ABV2EGI9_9CAUL
MTAIALPEIGTPARVVRGRSIHDGYQRGWGLMHAGLAEQVARSPLYQAGLEASGGWSVMVEAKRMNLFLILTRFLERLEGKDVIEFGSYRGGNALFMARVMWEIDPTAKVYSCDTFAGMPVTDAGRDLHAKGDFSDTSYEALLDRRDALGLTNLVVVKGLFQDTFPGIAKSRPRFGLAHIDCDIYSGVKYAQDAVWPRMARGGYLVYDDADAPSCIGATEAVEDLIMKRKLHAEQVWPHWVFRARL